MRARLPPDLVLPRKDSVLQQAAEQWAKYFAPWGEVPGFFTLVCARGVEDPSDAILSAPSPPSALESVLSAPQYIACFAGLGLERPPPHFTADRFISRIHVQPRMTIAEVSFPYPASADQRERLWEAGGIRVPLRFYEEIAARQNLTSLNRVLRPRVAWFWLREPRRRPGPEGREVETALLLQPWLTAAQEDFAAAEEPHVREICTEAVVRRLGLLAVRLDRYDVRDVYPGRNGRLTSMPRS